MRQNEKMSQHEITRLLHKYNAGDHEAFDKLFEFVYSDLYQIANKRRQEWQGDHTINATALLHELYLKLVDQSVANWQARSHFYATASRAMRQILINYARDRMRIKRGGNQIKIPFDELALTVSGELTFNDQRAEALIVLDEALKRLDEQNPRLSRIIECRFFGGMTIKETAVALDISPMTVKRSWKMAQLWLYREMKLQLDEEKS